MVEREKMMKVPAAEILEKIRKKEKVKNFKITGQVDLMMLIKAPKYELQREVYFENCEIDEMFCITIFFHGKVTLKKCTIKALNCNAAYFHGGLVIEDCEFEEEVDFQCGGHNINGTEIIFRNNVFKNFVNFFDCYYDGPFVMRSNTFEKGTNLLGNKGKPFEVSFETPPDIEENKGTLNLDGG